jgi:predicted TPR repeat methyltransferase
MPSSTWHNIETFVEIVWQLKPSTFLDIGVGNGKWGFLFREYTDVWNKRFVRSQWSSVVHGIEIYAPYVTENTHQREIYNQIFIGDATQIVDELDTYDVIYAGDVLEHIEKNASIVLLQKLIKKSKMAMICSIPLGTDWLCTRNWDNNYEDHVSTWDLDELKKLGFSLYNITRDPAIGTRQVGFFVYTSFPVKVAGLRPLRNSWFVGRRSSIA